MLALPERQMDPKVGDPNREYESRPRNSALSSVMCVWAQTDPDGADRWVRQSSLTEKQKRTMAQILEAQRRFRGK